MDKRKIYIISIGVVLVAGVIAYGVLRRNNISDNGNGAQPVRDNIQSTGEQQQRAGQEVRESQRITTEIRETNTIIKREIDDSRSINQSSSELIREGKSIFRAVRERPKSGTK